MFKTYVSLLSGHASHLIQLMGSSQEENFVAAATAIRNAQSQPIKKFRHTWMHSHSHRRRTPACWPVRYAAVCCWIIKVCYLQVRLRIKTHLWWSLC